MAHAILDDWTAGDVARWGLILAIAYFVLNIVCEANVRHFIEERGWDQFLTRFIGKMGPLLRDRRGYWFAFGLTIGAAIFMWVPPYIATPSTNLFVNPLHEDAAKWHISEVIRKATIAGVMSAKCHVTIVSLREQQQTQDYAADLEKVLDVINWKYDKRFADGPIDHGLSVRAVTNQLESRRCADVLVAALQGFARTRSGKALEIPREWVMNDEAPDYLKEKCPDAGLCIEVNFGSDDQQ